MDHTFRNDEDMIFWVKISETCCKILLCTHLHDSGPVWFRSWYLKILEFCDRKMKNFFWHGPSLRFQKHFNLSNYLYLVTIE